MSEMLETATLLAQKGKGLLAADESTATITKRFAAINIPCNETTRRDYRELLLTTPNLSEFVSGVILYEETLSQTTSSGVSFGELLKQHNIIPGIKVDKGLIQLESSTDEKVTQGLDGLAERLVEYKKKGARFAKWRAVFTISMNTPSHLAIHENAESLARYAAICQSIGIVPIVEPEVLIDGDHSLERCEAITEEVLYEVFHALETHQVIPECMILKPSMVITGKEHASPSSPEKIAEATVRVLRRTVPAAVPSINFLSGGQTPEEATANLNAINLVSASKPWNLSFSYGRALQEDVLKIWNGDAKNTKAAQDRLYLRAKLNGLASQGLYRTEMET